MLVNVVRQAYPLADIQLVVGAKLADRFEEFFGRHSAASGVVACPEIGCRSAIRWFSFYRAMRRRRFDACVVDADSKRLGAWSAFLCGIPMRAGFPSGTRADRFLTAPVRFPETKRTHPDLYDFALAYARALGLPDPAAREVAPHFRFKYDPSPYVRAPRPVVAVHAGGARHWNRRWPLARYRELCHRLCSERGATVLVLGGPEERPQTTSLRDGVLELWPAAEIHDRSGTSLNEMANDLVACDLFVGNDSSPMHMAAALGVPTVAVYGPSLAEYLLRRVYPNHVGVARRYECRKILPVPDESGRMPCRFHCPYAFDPDAPEYPKCLLDLTVDEVWRAIGQQLSLVERRTVPSAAGDGAASTSSRRSPAGGKLRAGPADVVDLSLQNPVLRGADEIPVHRDEGNLEPPDPRRC